MLSSLLSSISKRAGRFSAVMAIRKLSTGSLNSRSATSHPPSKTITLIATAAAIILSTTYVNSGQIPEAACVEEVRRSSEADLLVELSAILKPDQVERDLAEREQRAKPWNSYHYSKFVPSCILYPESTEDVSNILKVCNNLKVPVVAFGGGTSIEGQTLFMNPDSDVSVSLDFNRMTSVVEFNEEDLDITVQPGLGYIQLNDFLRSKGIWFPLDPGPGASIGGMCACRCSGSTAVKYGSMRENVLNVTAVLADGTVMKTGSRARKSSAGYDLTRLLIGSEGTLAIITEVTLKLHVIPKFAYAMQVSFSSLEGATSCARDTLKSGVSIGRCELLDEQMVEIFNRLSFDDKKMPDKSTLLYEITGVVESSVLEQMEIVKTIAAKNGGTEFKILTNETDCSALWRARKECLWSAMSTYPDKDVMITDVAVPLSKLPDMMKKTREILESTKVKYPSPIVAHAGDGNVHVLLFFNAKDPEQMKESKAAAAEMANAAIDFGGTCTGEHGVGTGKKELVAREMGRGSMSVMRKIKDVFDPNEILNPDKILDSKNQTAK